ncbi:MAG: CHAT domain-containing protein [Cyanobacteria bacterium P01_E01_bin.42]
MGDRISLVILVGVILSLNTIVVKANPMQAALDGTGTSIDRNSNTYVIQGGTLTGNNLFHSFQEFGLSAGEIARFLSSPHVENILSRVVGGNPSIIDGLLEVSGGNSHLYLMNPAGIIFGANASLNVPGDFFATTATGIGFGGDRIFYATGSNDYPNLNGAPIHFDFTLDNPAPIVNAGDLMVGMGNSIVLTGGTVINTGQLQALGGNITVAAVPGTSRIKISQAGTILTLEPDIPLSETGEPLTYTPLDLPALLVGAESQGVETGLAMNGAGAVQLASGQTIPWETGTVILTENIDASASLAGSLGGNVGIFGDRIALFNAEIDASGENGGGTVLIGGEYQGMGDLPTSDRVYIDGDSTIRADALSKGNGGRVIVWADDITGFQGEIFALGGSLAGDGGFVEVSGKDTLIFEGFTDTSAVKGREGTLLLDPTDITIGPNPPYSDSVGLAAVFNPGDTILSDGDIGGAVTINQATLEALSGNIILEASNNIFFNSATLNFTTASSIVFIADADNSGAGDVNMAFGSTINTNGADLTLIGERLFVQDINTGTGKVTLNGKNSVEFNNNPTTSTQDLTIRSNIIDFVTPVTMSGTGNLVLETATASRDIILGGTGGIPTALDLTTNELQTLQNGFASVTIGRTDGTGNIMISDPNSLTQPTHIAGAGNLIGSNQNTTWTLTGNNSGSLSGLANTTFDNVAALTGGSGDDIFAFASGANFNGSINGGGQSIGDTLDYSAYGSPITVNLGAGTATGTLGISNIESVINPVLATSAPISAPILASTTPPTSPVISSSSTLVLPDATAIYGQAPRQLVGSILDRQDENFDLTRQQVNNMLDRGDIAGAIAALDAYHSQSFLDYLGKDKAPSAPSLRELQSTLSRMSEETGETTATIYFFSRRDRLDIILVPPRAEPLHYSLPEVNRDTLLAEVQNLQQAIAHPLHRRNTRYLAPAQQLHKWLIAPAEKDLERFGIQTLMFVLDDGLRTLPMATLHDGDRFLVEKYATSLVPSLHFIAPHYVDVRNSSVVAMGMSEFTNNEALPAVPVEVDAIARGFNASETFLNEMFTLNALQQEPQRQQAQIVHLATHGQFQPGTPSESYIQLWDRSLTLEDMGALNWGEKSIELLVLSACRTAFGDRSAEYGFAGLTVQSGVSSAVASLWYANDAGTLALMTEFYHELRERPTKAQALRQAQIALIRGEVRLEKENNRSDSKESGALVSPFGRVILPPELANLNDRAFQHPYYWSGFTMIGSPW